MHTLFSIAAFPPSEPTSPKGIVFYDGQCGFCQRSVQLLLDLDKMSFFTFAPLQGETAKACLPEQLRQAENLSTMVYLKKTDKQQHFLRSDAIIGVLADLGGAFFLLSNLLRLVPRPVRNWCYDQIAKRRQVFSRRASCRILTEDEQRRFLT